MKKIALYIPNLLQGGAERVVSKLSYILAGKYDVDIILHENKIQYDINAPIRNLDVSAGKGTIDRIFGAFRRIGKLKRMKKEQGYSCVISFLNNANIYNILSGVSGCANVVSIRNYYGAKVYDKKTGLTTKIMDRLYPKADAVVPVTKYMERELLESTAVKAEKVFTIYNPFDIDEIEKNMNIDCLTDEEKAFCRDRFTFVYVGRLSKQKGLWHLVKAMGRLKNSNIGLMIVGEGEHRERIEDFISKNGLTNVMLCGLKANPFPYMKAADGFILPSLAEGFPNVLGEALCCGKPCIAADCKTGPREILCPDMDLHAPLDEITKGEYGILVPALENEENWQDAGKSDEMLAAAIDMMVSDKELREEYARKAAVRGADFSYASALAAFEELIERVSVK